MKMNNNKIIIVAGGAGFIGSNLCRRLLKDGNKVICIDNLSSGLESNIRDLYINSDFLFIEHDIIEPFSRNIDCDEIYNFACPASPKFYQKDYLNTLFTNMYGMKNLLDLATRNNAVILQASTSLAILKLRYGSFLSFSNNPVTKTTCTLSLSSG